MANFLSRYDRLVLMAACALLVACTKREQPQEPKAQPSAAMSVIERKDKDVNIAEATVEPPESVLREFMFRQYEELEARGGLPATVTASGKSGVIRTRLYEVNKDECKPSPVGPEGVWDCSVSLKVDMWWEGQREPGTPSADNKRISVMKNEKGVWVDCEQHSKWDGICSKGLTKR